MKTKKEDSLRGRLLNSLTDIIQWKGMNINILKEEVDRIYEEYKCKHEKWSYYKKVEDKNYIHFYCHCLICDATWRKLKVNQKWVIDDFFNEKGYVKNE